MALDTDQRYHHDTVSRNVEFLSQGGHGGVISYNGERHIVWDSRVCDDNLITPKPPLEMADDVVDMLNNGKDVVFLTGVMHSGKTKTAGLVCETLVESGLVVAYFRPGVAREIEPGLSGVSKNVIAAKSRKEFLDSLKGFNGDVAFIDEMNVLGFLPGEESSEEFFFNVEAEISDMQQRGIKVVGALLDVDFRNQPFAPIGMVRGYVERSNGRAIEVGIHSQCVCGEPACVSTRTNGSVDLGDGRMLYTPVPLESEQFAIEDVYVSLCIDCHALATNLK